jgi:hypothetical protein
VVEMDVPAALGATTFVLDPKWRDFHLCRLRREDPYYAEDTKEREGREMKRKRRTQATHKLRTSDSVALPPDQAALLTELLEDRDLALNRLDALFAKPKDDRSPDPWEDLEGQFALDPQHATWTPMRARVRRRKRG